MYYVKLGIGKEKQASVLHQIRYRKTKTAVCTTSN